MTVMKLDDATGQLREEGAREHIRNALAILVPLRDYVQQPAPNAVRIEASDLRAIEMRLRRALDNIEKGGPL